MAPIQIVQESHASLDPTPSAVTELVKEWIRDARAELVHGTTKQQLCSSHENARHLWGELRIEAAGPKRIDLQVYIHRKHLTKGHRFILLHFYSKRDKPRSLLKDRKEVAFIYFEADSGSLHGLHVAPDHRGRGLMKPIFLYYVLFCRQFSLLADTTAPSSKPLFAKLYDQMGYKPDSLYFPFLLLPRDADLSRQTDLSFIVPLPAENPREGTRRDGDKSWTFSPKFAASQALSIVDNSSSPNKDGAVKLYAKTAWSLPTEETFAHRESVLEELCRTTECVMYTDRVESDMVDEQSACQVATAPSVGALNESSGAFQPCVAKGYSLKVSGLTSTTTATVGPDFSAEELEPPSVSTHERLIEIVRETEAEFALLGPHDPCYTCEDAARVRVQCGWRDASLHSGAKAMLLHKVDGSWLLCVLPADCKFSWKKILAMYEKGIRLATEEEVRDVAGCLPGAVPPIASSFPMHVECIADSTLPKMIDFNSGLRTRSMQMARSAYERIEKPTIVDIIE